MHIFAHFGKSEDMIWNYVIVDLNKVPSGDNRKFTTSEHTFIHV